jgi:hypothetical protein
MMAQAGMDTVTHVGAEKGLRLDGGVFNYFAMIFRLYIEREL